MTNKQKNLFEAIGELRRAAYQRFNDRRSYEWKFALGIWSAQMLLLGDILQTEKYSQRPGVWIGISVIGIAIILLHLCWNYIACKRNSEDKKVSYFFNDEMMKILEMDAKFYELTKFPKPDEIIIKMKWSNLIQVIGTAILAMGTVIILFIKTY